MYKIDRRKIIKQLIPIEFNMYWNYPVWIELWNKEFKKLYIKLINDYFQNFPEGLIIEEEKNKLVAFTSIIKLNEIKALSYSHNVLKELKRKGDIAYVSIFDIKSNKLTFEIADDLYLKIEKLAKELKCRSVVCLIYQSELEEKTIIARGYKLEANNYKWEIYPKKIVLAKIYQKQLI